MQGVLSSRLPHHQLRRTPLDLAALFVLMVIMAVLTTAAFWAFWHTNRIYTGVTIGGVPVGGLTRTEALRQLNEQLPAYPLPPVTITYQGQKWPLQTAQAKTEADLLGAVNRAYLVGRTGDWADDIAIQSLTALRQTEVTPQLAIDEAALRAALTRLAMAVEKPGMAARQIGDVSIPAEPGVRVDVEATLQGVLGALQRTSLHEMAEVPLVTAAVLPPAESTPGETAALASAAPAQPILLRDDQFGLEFAIAPAAVNGGLGSSQPVQVDEAQLRALLASLAEQVSVPARNARLRFNPLTGGVTVLQPSQPGRRLNVDATVAAVRDALAAGSAEAPLVVEKVEPAVDMNKTAEMGIRELVVSGSTYFAGSSASRIRNIEVAADKFDGVVIPPEGLFSFNDIVRDVSSANGFEDSLIIWGDRTAVGVGGGVCQVSTTIFRAAYEGGFPIVQRYNHGYVVDWYGKPGLDATIFTPTVDFQFRNDTGAYLLIEPVVDAVNGVITFNLYGTKPDREVTISEPEISDIIEPEAPIYTVDESLAPGQKKQVDWEKEGMTVTVRRTIVENGTTRTDTLTSKYQPWRAVYLVGPGTDIPATPTPVATATP
ncbi:MAG: VanW family protein [Caldilineaceae bacterium]|nr:VanW family protein [Caldilineaceae bacterium]